MSSVHYIATMMFGHRSPRFWWYMFLYGLMLYGSIAVLDHEHGLSLGERIAVSLLPMLPAFGVMTTVMDRWRTLDELQRKVQSEALVFAFCATAIVTFSYGFVENVGAPMISYFFVWPVMATAWIVGLFLANRRYR